MWVARSLLENALSYSTPVIVSASTSSDHARGTQDPSMIVPRRRADIAVRGGQHRERHVPRGERDDVHFAPAYCSSTPASAAPSGVRPNASSRNVLLTRPCSAWE